MVDELNAEFDTEMQKYKLERKNVEEEQLKILDEMQDIAKGLEAMKR